MSLRFLKWWPQAALRLVVAFSVAQFVIAPAGAQTVTAVMQSGLRVLDPIMNTAGITRSHAFMIYDTLLATDANFKIQPQMAEKWEVTNDGKTYTFTLRDGLKWHDGTSVNAEDCVASFKRWATVDGVGQILMKMVNDIKIIDDKTFQIDLNEPSTLVLNSLSSLGSRIAFMMPKRIADTPATQPIKEYIGSGPFKFVTSEYKPGLKVVYEKNKDYVSRSESPSWMAGGKHVYVDRVAWVTMPDLMTPVNALVNGEIDYIEIMPFDLLPMVKGNKDIKVEVLDELGRLTYARFNHLYPPFDNKLIRQAAMYAVGQADILEAMVGNPRYYKMCASVFGCGVPYENDFGADMIIPSNIDKAKALLKEAKYDGTPVVILHSSDQSWHATQPVVIAAALRKAGFKVDVQAMDWQTLITRRTSQKPPAEGGWNIFVTASAVSFILEPLRSIIILASGKKAWFGWPDVPEIEVLRNKFAHTSDEAERKNITSQIQKLALDEGVVAPQGQFTSPTAYSRKLSGILKSPVSIFWNIKKSDR